MSDIDAIHGFYADNRRVSNKLRFFYLTYLNFQSIAHTFMLTFDNFCDCVGTQRPFVKKKCQKAWWLRKIDVPLQPLS